jgi:hypothetical protein
VSTLKGLKKGQDSAGQSDNLSENPYRETMFKLIWNLFKLLFFAAVLAIIFQQFTARFVLTMLLRAELGVPVEVEHAQVDILKAQVRFQNIEIWNPDSFPAGVMIYIREMTADSELTRMFINRALNLERLEIRVDNVRLVQAPDGRLNYFMLKLYQKPEGSILKNLAIENFVLSIDRAGVAGADPREALSQEIGLNRMGYRKVKALRDIFDIIGWETLSAMKLQKLGKSYLSRIGEDLGGSSGDFPKPAAANWR